MIRGERRASSVMGKVHGDVAQQLSNAHLICKVRNVNKRPCPSFSGSLQRYLALIKMGVWIYRFKNCRGIYVDRSYSQ